VPELIRSMDKHFATHNYTLWHLFKDEQREVFEQIMESSLDRIEINFRQIYEDEYPLMQAMREMGIPLPQPMTTSIEYVFNHDLEHLLKKETIDFDRLENLIQDFQDWNISPDLETLQFVASERINKFMLELAQNPLKVEIIRELEHLLHLLQSLPLELDLWEAQNIYFNIGKSQFRSLQKQAERENADAEAWVEHFTRLGDYLNVRVE
jgi:AcrR family transcriptional regulator